MAAYASLVSLMQIFHQIEHHPSLPISMDEKQVESLTDIVVFLQEFLEGYKSPYADGDEVDPLEMHIADAVYAAEDAIESHIVDQLVPAEAASAGSSTSPDLYESLVKVIEDMCLIKKEVMEIVAAKVSASSSPSVGSSTSTKSSSPSWLKSTTMVGFDDVMLQLMDKLTDGRVGRQVIPIVGMGGIGKTTLASNVYEKPLITHHFDICVWVTISQQYNTTELLCEILSQSNKQGLSKMSDNEAGVALHKCLSSRRYLVVLDDMWSIEAWEKIQLYFPDNSNGSRIMVTTRLLNLGSRLDSNYAIEMEFMNEESSWNLFCKTVFGGKSCPSELEKIGKKIVESCRGLPLSIVVMGGLLEKMERTNECWESMRRSINSQVNAENEKLCINILKLSYNHLPVYLKPCFLYLGIFEEDCRIRVSTVIKLWVSEGFLKPKNGKSLETVAKEYFDELVDRNLILVHKLGQTGKIKYYKIHDLLRNLCLREAEKERFYDVVGQYSSPKGPCGQRRVLIMESTSEEKVVDAMKSRPYARTCISDHERVRLLENLRLLRILKAHDKDFLYRGQEYSLEKLFELVHLRLLFVYSEGTSAQLSSSINRLWSLQTLIVDSTKNMNAPVEIWNMPQLRHVHFYVFRWGAGVRGALHLPDPPSESVVTMENLQTLKGVSNFKCDEMMVRRIPNIKKLGLIYYENGRTESRDDEDADEYCVKNMERLQKMESLSCKSYGRGDLLRKLTFPYSLKSLTLTIKNGRMEEILGKVSTLPLLQKLKLTYGVFTTGKWETFEDQFLSLKYLSLGFVLGLEWWVMESSHFPCLEHLYLSNILSLKEIPAELGEISTLKSVILDGCSRAVAKSAQRMVQEQEELQGVEQLSFKVEVFLQDAGNYKYNGVDELYELLSLLRLKNANFQVTLL